MAKRVRWLSADEQGAWRAFIAADALLWARLERDLQVESAMIHSEYAILVRLSEATDRRVRMADLAADTQNSRSRLSHAINRLERAGYVERAQCPEDRRGLFAVLTDDGFAALEAAAPRHVESVRRAIFDRLTAAQVQQLEQIASAIRDGLESAGCDGSAGE